MAKKIKVNNKPKTTKKSSKANGALEAVFTGDTKNYSKFTVVSDGHVGSIYFPVDKKMTAKTITVKLVMPDDSKWEDKMEELIENTSSPKALNNLKRCLNDNS